MAAPEWLRELEGPLRGLEFDARAGLASAVLRCLPEDGATRRKLDALDAITESDRDVTDHEHVVTQAAISVAILRDDAVNPDDNLLVGLQQHLLIPLLHQSVRICQEGASRLVETMAFRQHGAVMASMLSLCCRSMGVKAPPPDEVVASFKVFEAGAIDVLSVPIACNLFSTLLGPFLDHANKAGGDLKNDVLLHWVHDAVFPIALEMMESEEPEWNRLAVQVVLPILVQVSAFLGDDAHQESVSLLWTRCKALMQEDKTCNTALAAMIRFAGEFGLREPSSSMISRAAMDEGFWSGLKAAMVHKDAIVRKRSRFILECVWQGDGVHDWKEIFLALYDLLDEFAVHFVKGKWDHIDLLHAPSQPALVTSASDVKPNESQPKKLEGRAQNVEQRQEVGDVDFSWMSILWNKAFHHDNHQVIRLGLMTFFEREWTCSWLSSVSINFVVSELLPILGHPSLHSDPTQFDFQSAADRFLETYTPVLTIEDQCKLLNTMVHCIAKETVPRLTLICWTSSLKAVTAAARKRCLPDTQAESFLGHVQGALANCRDYHGNELKRQAYESLVACVAIVANPARVVVALGRCLLQLPLQLIRPGGALHSQAVAWLAHDGVSLESFVKGLDAEVNKFFNIAGRGVGGLEQISTELPMWHHEAQLLARLLFFAGECSADDAQILPLVDALTQRLQALHARLYLPYETVAKTLSLLHELTKVLHACSAQQESRIGIKCASIFIAGANSLSSYARSQVLSLLEAAEPWRLAYGECAVPAAQIQTSRPAPASGEYGKRQSCLPEKVWCQYQLALMAVECLTGGLTALLEHGDDAQRQGGSYCPTEIMAGSTVALLNTIVRDFGTKGWVSDAEGLECLGNMLQLVSALCEGLRTASCITAKSQDLGMALQNQIVLPDLSELLAMAEFSVVPAPQAAGNRLPGGGDWSTVLQHFESSRWHCIDAVLSVHECGLCSSGAVSYAQKAGVLTSILDAFEFAGAGLLVSLLRCIRPFLRDLVRDAEFLAAVATASGLLEAGSEEPPLAPVFWRVVRSMWIAFLDARKRALVCAAFINTAMLPELFELKDTDDPKWALHVDGGPCSWLVTQLLWLGQRSPRVMLLTTVQLTRVWLDCPQLVDAYLGQLTQIICHGSLDKNHTEAMADAAPAESWLSRELSTLATPLDPDLLQAHALTDVGPRVSAICFLHELALLAGLAWDCGRDASDDVKRQAEQSGKGIWNHLLDLATNDRVQTQTQYKVGSNTHRLKLRVWQAICVSSHFVHTSDSVRRAVGTLVEMLKKGNVASVRQYIEATLLRLLLREPGLTFEAVMPSIQQYEKRHDALPSFVLVAAQVALHAPDADIRAQLAPLVIRATLPWALCHHHSTRAFSQLVVQALAQEFTNLVSTRQRLEDQSTEVLKDQSTEVTEGEGPQGPASALGPDLLDQVMRFLRENADMARLRRTLGVAMGCFRPDQLATPRGVLVTGSNMAGGAEEPVALEGAPECLLDSLFGFLAAERVKVRETNARNAVAKESGPCAPVPPPAPREGPVGNFQRKIRPLDGTDGPQGRDAIELWALGRADASPDFEDALRTAALDAHQHWHLLPRRQEIILVASLIEKAPNLAGLARTAEVFHASALVVADGRITKDYGFTSISVTAEQWVPIIEVPPVALGAWLAERRREGFHLLGLEQTTDSASLCKFEFPARCVLVLGRERDGIPADLLQVMDGTVEIPQLGVVRSLNVHVSGAIALYEYTRQRLHGREDAGVGAQGTCV